MRARNDDLGANGASESPGTRSLIRRRGAHIGSLAVMLVIALQVAVPTIALLLPPPQRFGFQMYSGLGAPTVVVVDSEGVEHDFDETPQLLAKLRPEIDWLRKLPEAVCEAAPDAAFVRVQQSGGERAVECD